MSLPGPTQRCAICPESGPFDEHHVAGRANLPTATIPLCVKCHPVQTERHRTAGVALEARRNPDPAQILWAFASGFAALISTWAEGLEHPPRPAGPALIAFVCAVVDSERSDDGTTIGPDPIANARRRSERSRLRRTSPRTSRRSAVTAADGAAFFVAFLRAISNASNELLAEAPRFNAYLDTLALAAGQPEILQTRLREIADSTTIVDLAQIAMDDGQLLEAVVTRLTAAVSAGKVDDGLVALARRLAVREAGYLRLLRALVEPADGGGVQASLEQFVHESEAGG